MPTEVDPLLPQTAPTPEISGYGFSPVNNSRDLKGSYSRRTWSDDDDEEGDGDGDSPPDAPSNPPAAFSSIIGIFSLVVFLAFVVAFLSDGGDQLPQPGAPPIPSHRPALSIDERVSEVLSSTPLIDGHNDLAIFVRFAYKNLIHSPTFVSRFEDGGMEAQVDIPRLREGRVGGAFWSAFVPCPSNASTDFSDAQYAEAVSTTLSQLDLLRRLQALYPSVFTPATASLETALSAFHANKTLISPLSIEGLHQVPQSAPLSTLRLYYSLGVRAATLTWNCHNAFADASLISTLEGTVIAEPSPQRPSGLTPRGRVVLREMNRLGMLIDLSHTARWTQTAVLSNSTSLAPVIFSHSSAYSLCPHPRNVHDSVLDLVQATDSLVMINFSPDFVSCTPANSSSLSSSSSSTSPPALPTFFPANSTLHQVARHVVYIGHRIGFAHVGIGSDFDGMGETPRGLDGVDKFPALVAELLRMGVSDEDAKKVVGGNLLRVWQKVEKVARQMREEGVVEGEDEVLPWGSGGPP